MPPTIVKPLADITYTPTYSNTSFHVTCEAYGVPDVTLTLLRGGAELGDDEFTAESYNISGDWPYDVTQASGTRFYWRLDADYVTCSNVSSYDADDYVCVASNLDPEFSERNVTSLPIAINTQCKNTYLNKMKSIFLFWRTTIETFSFSTLAMVTLLKRHNMPLL